MARVLRSLPQRFASLQHASSTSSSPPPWKHFLHTTTACAQQVETAASTAAPAAPAPPLYRSEDIPTDPYFAELGRLPSEKVIRIADEMLSLSVLEVSDVADLLKKKLKISHMPMLGLGGGGGMAGAAAQAAEEKKPAKTTFEVKLEKYDAGAKIKIIKEIRTFTSLGLKEAKELVEKTPAVLKTGISKEEAMDIVEKLKAVGATVVME